MRISYDLDGAKGIVHLNILQARGRTYQLPVGAIVSEVIIQLFLHVLWLRTDR